MYVLKFFDEAKKSFPFSYSVATAFYPRFRLMWLQKHNPDRISAVKEAMELQVEACMKEEDEVAAASSSDTSVEENPEDDWFGTITQAPSTRARTS
jgi:hypothetical protein